MLGQIQNINKYILFFNFYDFWQLSQGAVATIPCDDSYLMKMVGHEHKFIQNQTIQQLPKAFCPEYLKILCTQTIKEFFEKQYHGFKIIVFTIVLL